MKKLYENIEDIYIKGSPTELSDVITSMDLTLQKIADQTEQITTLILKYSQSNSGLQYEKVATTLQTLSNNLYESSIELNEMQHEIVRYQNKILRYEGLSESASMPNPHMVQRVQINVETQTVQFNLSDMMDVAEKIDSYSNSVYNDLCNLVESKNSIATIWLDSQYNDFSAFIDDLSLETIEALKVFDDYVSYLDDRIRDLR